jgi:DNA mismatch endonuclease, patch repair protein
MDNVSINRRSEIMRAVKSKDSKIETAFRKALWSKGFRYRKNSTKYFGKPDIILKRFKTVIFIDSCFWHGCRYHCRIPSSNKKYWQNKIFRNKLRDKLVNQHYKKIGWQNVRIWEHQV